MSPVQVTQDDLASASAQLSAGSQQISSQLSSMQATVQALAGSGWPGAELSTFGSLCQQCNTAAANLCEALEGISRLVANGATSLRAR